MARELGPGAGEIPSSTWLFQLKDKGGSLAMTAINEDTKPLVIILNWRDWTQADSGGAENFVAAMSKELVFLGHPVHVVTERTPGSLREEVIHGIRVSRRGGKLTRFLAAAFEARRLMRSNDRAIIIESVNTVPYLAKLYGRGRVVTLIHHVAGRELLSEIPFPLSVVLWGVERAAPYWSSHCCVATCDQSRRELIRIGLASSRIHIIHPLPESRPPTGIVKSPVSHVICYLGPLKRYKGVIDVVVAFATIVKWFPDARLEIAGRGYLAKEIADRVRTLGLERSVSLHGYVDSARKTEILSRATVFAYPSASEGGWSLSVFEAMQTGIPAVVTPALAEMVSSGGGVIVPYGRPDLLAESIARLWRSPNEFARCSTEAQSWALKTRSIGIGAATEGVLELLEHRGSR
jgi:glycosyltransferase involved in cell wall biosynthesis